MGKHEIRIEGDVLFLKWVGELSQSDVREIFDTMARMLAEHKWVFMVIDARNATGWGRDARRTAIDWPHQHRVGAVVHIGASLTIRALTGLIAPALKMLRRASPVPMYVNDEEQALACVQARRRELLASAEPRAH